ncbi:MAG: hypothetical protein NUV77_15995 [Thermoguttaceae bacterium]|jgi:hypothetical protein|nr:hypothetical protein [Thermoguttaceae bacterium]
MIMRVCALCGIVLGAPVGACAAAETPPPIEKVEIGPARAIHVNGKPFFPIMAWLQDPANFAEVKQCGMNTTAGYWSGSGGTKDAAEYLKLVEQAGLYGVMPFDSRLKGHRSLLAYIHDDEPDLPHQVSDAEVVPGAGLRLNRSTPLWRMVDGVTHTWSVLDPLAGARVTIRRKEPVTAQAVALWLTISPGLAVAKEVSLEADGNEVLRATLKSQRGQQKLTLPRPVTFRELTLVVHSVYPDKNAWGSIGEIEAFDAAGRNVLLSPPRHEPRATPDEVLRKYRAIKTADPSRPVFMTLTGHFHPHFEKWTDSQRKSLYPAYLAAADVVGYDIYPIYGWNKPEWIHLVHDATGLLAGMSAPRPVYAWIETSKGGQWTGPLEKQKDVKPEHIRAEVWMALVRGATAIGYFTHVWKPSYRQFGLPDENRRALREINGQIARLAPALLSAEPAPAVRIKGGGVKLDATARQHGGKTLVFAVNYDERFQRAQARIEVEGLAAGVPIEVVDEGRTLRSDAGGFGDTFEPLAVHIYRIAP